MQCTLRSVQCAVYSFSGTKPWVRQRKPHPDKARTLGQYWGQCWGTAGTEAARFGTLGQTGKVLKKT